MVNAGCNLTTPDTFEMPNNTTSGNTRISLLERARLRDALAWRQLANLYGPLVASWCRKSLTDPHAVADCVQDVFASVAVSLDSFEPTHKVGSFRAWLWTITRNKIRDHIRRNGKHPLGTGRSSMMLALNNVVDPVPNEEPTESLQLQELTERALAQVRLEFEERTWQAFWRSVVDGICSAQVAQELGITAATVRQYRSRILRRLRQQLGDVP